jgi:hypothetical protein
MDMEFVKVDDTIGFIFNGPPSGMVGGGPPFSYLSIGVTHCHGSALLGTPFFGLSPKVSVKQQFGGSNYQ